MVVQNRYGDLKYIFGTVPVSLDGVSKLGFKDATIHVRVSTLVCTLRLRVASARPDMTERRYLAALLQKPVFSITLHRRAVLSCLSIAA